jgi:hypothetical protein
MIKSIAWAFAALLFIAAAAGLGFWLAPLMLASGRPELILLAYLLPFCGVVAGLALYIAWADSGWSAPDDPGEEAQVGASPSHGPLLPALH